MLGKPGEFCQAFMDFCLTNCSHQLVSEESYSVLITEDTVMQTGIHPVSHKVVREP